MRILSVLVLVVMFFLSCKREPGAAKSADKKISYGDSVFYLKSASYTIAPVNAKAGTYTAFPDNLKINSATGAITVSLNGNDGQSQTGLRYKIKFTSTSNEVDSTYITIAGINYVDKFYHLSQNEDFIRPVYNADLSTPLPSGSYTADDNDLAINPSNGHIDIRKTIENGFFDNQLNSSWKEVTVEYRTSDNNNVTNSIDIILYYYNSVNDIPSNVSALMQAHQRMTLGVNSTLIPSTFGPVDNNLDSDLSLFKPRPPCIIIVGH